jgi:AraC-like DNA-binding protein
MLTEQFDAGSAAYEVGYTSPSQFNREYGRLFGGPSTSGRQAAATGSIGSADCLA